MAITLPGGRAVRIMSLLSLSLSGMLLQAQVRPPVTGFRSAPRVGIGYVANIPTTFLGFSALAVTPKILGGAGLYADFKRTTGSPGDSPYYLSGVSVTDAELTYGDMLYKEESDWVAVNVAVVYALTNEFALYAGAGYSQQEHYREYYDDTQTRGNLGFYWVSDPDASGTRINILGGGLIRIASFLVFQLGLETQPRGANLGGILTLGL